MKTTGLTLQEALQALVDGKAKKAVHPCAAQTFLYYDNTRNCFAWEYDNSSAIATFTKEYIVRPEWSLIDPVQEYEDVEVVRWVVCGENIISSLGLTSKASAEEFATQYPGSRIIKLTGIDRVLKKEKVVRRVDVGAGVTSDGDVWGITNNFLFKDCTEAHGKTGKLIFEWEE